MKKCADPVLCYTRGGTRVYRHYSLSSPIVKLFHKQVFNCGKCVFCRKKKSYELAVRCVLHASLYKENCFLTLTYDETKPGYHNKFEYSDIQKLKKRLRRWVEYHYGQKIQIFNVHEYGKNGKKHWHLVVFGFDFSRDPKFARPRELFTVRNGNKLYTSVRLNALWPYGFNTVGSVTEASAMYQAQYTQKDLKNGNMTNEKKSHSKHSGIGREYFLKHYDQILSLGFIPVGGRKIPIPRYFLKLAHKHWSHFNEPSNFVDTSTRKKLYSPFRPEKYDFPSIDISEKFAKHILVRKQKINEMIAEWEAFVAENAFNDEKPEFLKSAENFEYDLKNKTGLQEF